MEGPDRVVRQRHLIQVMSAKEGKRVMVILA